ncbi:MAG: prepilin-type N-terminal cleavage/methylation domain-containing protein [Patescibacteria group bacterium]
MRNYFVQNKGFTLIELLIVIALLGALAVGLLATIDPFEQLKKGRDTSLRNTVSEFYNANLRYYATKGEFFWGTSGSAGLLYPGFTSTIAELITVGELKNRFQELAGSGNLAKIYVNSTSSEHISACYKPESKAFQEDLNTIYDSSGATSGVACKSQTTGTAGSDCWFCIQ